MSVMGVRCIARRASSPIIGSQKFVNVNDVASIVCMQYMDLRNVHICVSMIDGQNNRKSIDAA